MIREKIEESYITEQEVLFLSQFMKLCKKTTLKQDKARARRMGFTEKDLKSLCKNTFIKVGNIEICEGCYCNMIGIKSYFEDRLKESKK